MTPEEEEQLDKDNVEIVIDILREILESGDSYRNIRRKLIEELELDLDDPLRDITREYYDKAAIELLGFKTAEAEIRADEYLILLKGDYVSPKPKVKKKSFFS